jgi:hypothetical protein
MLYKELPPELQSRFVKIRARGLDLKAKRVEKVIVKSEDEFRRSIEDIWSESDVSPKDILGEDFCDKVGAPFFRMFYDRPSENPYVVVRQLIEAVMIGGGASVVRNILRPVLCSFLPSVNDHPHEKERISGLALRLPEFARVIVAFSKLATTTDLNLYANGIELYRIFCLYASWEFDPLNASLFLAEKIVSSENFLNNWSEALKLWVQGGIVSKLSNRDEGEILKGK